MKQILLLLAVVFITQSLPAQTYYYYSRTEYTYGPYYFKETLNFVDRLIQSKEEKEKREAERAQMRRQTQDMRNYYGSFSEYPAKVADGWHSVVILGGEEYIGDRKVLVENGRVKRMVWDNWMEEELTFSGPVVKAMTGVRIKGGIGPMNGLIDVYFMNSLGENPVMAEPPLTPGTVTFWTSHKDYDLGKLYLVFEDAAMGPFTEHRDWDKAPECGDINQINVVYKPGIYDFKLVRKGFTGYNTARPLMAGKIELTENGCSVVEVYENAKKRKGPKQKKK